MADLPDIFTGEPVEAGTLHADIAFTPPADAVDKGNFFQDCERDEHGHCKPGTGGGGGGEHQDEGGGHAKHVEGWASKISSLPAKIAGKVKAKAQGYYKKLSDRYGGKMAIAIMAAGVAGLPIPLPGSSLITAAPVIAVAELIRHFTKAVEDTDADLSPEEIERLGKEFIQQLLDEWQAEMKDEPQEDN